METPWNQLFPEYTFLHLIGKGAYGHVWLVQTPEGGHLALKWIPNTPGEDPARYLRENRAIRLFQTLAPPPEGVIPILEIREDPEGFAYTMPLADPVRPNWQADPAQYTPLTLRARLEAGRALPFTECLAIATRLAQALQTLHTHCLVHRDIKPTNIIYLDGLPVLADIGLLVDTREAASYVGTQGYASPETQGSIPGDLYSLGVLLHEATTGLPITQLFHAPAEEADTAAPGFPAFLQIIQKAAHPDPAHRYHTTTALLKDLAAAQNPPKTKKWHWLWLLPALLILTVAIAMLTHPAPTESPTPAQNYQTIPIAQWDETIWPEFFTALSNRIGGGEWRYVKSPSGGGHWGFVQHYFANKELDAIIWLEQERLTLKILVNTPSVRVSFRDLTIKLFFQSHPPDNFRFIRPPHLGIGQSMTIALLDGPYLKQKPNGSLDMEATTRFLQKIEEYVKEQLVIISNSPELAALFAQNTVDPYESITETNPPAIGWRIARNGISQHYTFYIPETLTQTGAFLAVYEDRLLIGQGTKSDMGDWRIILLTHTLPHLTILPISTNPSDLHPSTPLITCSPLNTPHTAQPTGMAPLTRTLSTIRAIALTPNQPGQWEAWVTNQNQHSTTFQNAYSALFDHWHQTYPNNRFDESPN